MSKQNIEESVESRVCFEELEDWVREKIRGWVQELLEEEVTELLGRRKSERRRAVDAPSGYRNGYGKPRHLTLSSGTIQVRRPRVRDLARIDHRFGNEGDFGRPERFSESFAIDPVQVE